MQIGNRDALYCRTMIENKLHKLNGKECERFIVDLMCTDNENLVPLKPDGVEGDWATDLIDQVNHTLFQIYAPEFKDKQSNLSSAKSKLTHDFKRSYDKWTQKGFVITGWVFILNDKFQGIYPTLMSDLNQIKNQYHLSRADIINSSNILDMGVRLYNDKAKTDRLKEIIGKIFIEIPESMIDSFDDLSPLYIVCESLFSVMKTAVISNRYNDIRLTEVQKKIEINNLSPLISSKVLSFLDRISLVTDVYDNLDDYIQEQVRDIIIKTYNEESVKSDDNDLVFVSVVDTLNSYIPQNALVQFALSVIIAYHFELCDIFSRGLD